MVHTSISVRYCLHVGGSVSGHWSCGSVVPNCRWGQLFMDPVQLVMDSGLLTEVS